MGRRQSTTSPGCEEDDGAEASERGKRQGEIVTTDIANKGSDRSVTAEAGLSVTVVICAYTLDRWDLLIAAVRSIGRQSTPPLEVIVCIDHNAELFARCQAELPSLTGDVLECPLKIIENRYEGRLGSARTSAAEVATGAVLAFLDDDAEATPAWLGVLLREYRDRGVMAVGGAPLPRYGTARPRWFPFECDWIFGCAYRGLPEVSGPVRHLIGANMSVRRAALLEVGGFHSDDHDDMDMCHRVAHLYGKDAVVFQPAATVAHFVPGERLRWRYYWRRCLFVNFGKVRAFGNMGEASDLQAELQFVGRALTRAAAAEARALRKGDVFAVARYGALLAAITLAGAGNLAAQVWLRYDQLRTGRRAIGA